MAKGHALFAAPALVFLLLIATAQCYDMPMTDPVQGYGGGGGGGGGSEARQFLLPHNAVRLALRMRPLVWDAKLAEYARWWASERQYDCDLVHSQGPYGENIFWGSGEGWTPAQAVSSWVAERQSYDYYSNSCTGEACGHYTQVVWRDTRRLGCASVTCANGRGTFITCNYDPAGNYINERPY